MAYPRPLLLSALLLLAINLSSVPASLVMHDSDLAPPAPSREFRGAWVATVANIDWPSKPGLPVDQQQAEMVAILDSAKNLNMNAIVLQVRPACDAIYESRLEPWSEYLTGQMGQAPSPRYDPLQFAVEEAHKRGIELHAWFNPYRARHSEAQSPICPTHISVEHPNFVRRYGSSLWLDPSEKGVQDHSIDVILDVVKRYDIDGVHLDDYFYPYKEKGPDGRTLDFPDDANWKRYGDGHGQLSRDDWRRDQVNRFIQRLYRSVGRAKPWVKIGISPFGIWRPGSPAGVRGFDAYTEIYADSRRWLNEGWVDYLSPQLYWKQGQAGQSYSDLLHWWVGQNVKSRHIWPGNYASRVEDGSKTSWAADEIVRQIDITRHEQGAGGNLQFSMKALMAPKTGLAQALKTSSYAEPALVPASPWLRREKLGRPRLSIDHSNPGAEASLQWRESGHGKPWLWLLQIRRGNAWRTTVLPAEVTTQSLSGVRPGERSAVVAVTPVDRCGNLGTPNVVEVMTPDAQVSPEAPIGAPPAPRPIDSTGRTNRGGG